MTDVQKWSISYTDVFNKKTVESFDSQGEAQSRYEALIPRTYGDLGDLVCVSAPVKKVTEAFEGKGIDWDSIQDIFHKYIIAGDSPNSLPVKSGDYTLEKGSIHGVLKDSSGKPLFGCDYDFSDDTRGDIFVANIGMSPADFAKVKDIAWDIAKECDNGYYSAYVHAYADEDGYHKDSLNDFGKNDYARACGIFDEDCGGASAASLGAVPTGVVGSKAPSKRSEAKNPYYGYGPDDSIDKDDNDFMWQVAYDWFEERLPEKLKQNADRAVTEVIDSDMQAYEEIVTMDDYYDYLETYGPAVIEEITSDFAESKKNESGGADLASVYGSGDIVTHENSADGFYVDDHDPMGWAILNNDVDTMKELFAGTAPTPDKPWLYAGWDEYTDAPADKDGVYPYRYSWDSERDLNFVENWKRVVGETNNEEALNLLLEHDPNFIPTAIDFYNAFLAGYDKKLLRKLLDNIRAVWDVDDINGSYLNYDDFGEDAYNNLDKFLDASESCKSEALPPKPWNGKTRKFPSRAALVKKAKELRATEIGDFDDYTKKNKDLFLDKIGFAMDINGNSVARLWWGENDGKYYYSTSRDVLDKTV